MRRELLLFISIFLLVACSEYDQDTRLTLGLAGTWQFALDSAYVGIEQEWYRIDLDDTIDLPGTTDSNRKGFVNTDTTTQHLNRKYLYEGPAWYRKRVVVPEDFRDKHVRLFIERTKPSMIWVDSILIGESKLLQSPQIFDVTDCIEPGEQYITIRIDNSPYLTPYGHAHIYAEDTQTNWHGMIGTLQLEARQKTYIENLRIYPDIDNRKIDVEMSVVNGMNIPEVRIDLHAVRTIDGRTTRLERQTIETELDSVLFLEYYLGDESWLWDEYQQPVYHLKVTLSHGDISDSETAVFGMRNFTVNGTQFDINGRTTFLRGKHDGAIFPLTGHTPMDVENWERIFRIARSYGINHYRYHSYSPPEAAFVAADRVGMYLQVELPFWGGLESDSVMYMLREEGFAMLRHYANHPSFVMFSHGNEIWSGHDRVERNIAALRNYDGRPLYTTGSNNNIGYVGPGTYSDYHVAARTPFAHDTTLTHTRLTHAFVDSRDGGILNTRIPSTAVNFAYPVSIIDMPIITHEIGQYQIYPDYNEIDKYTGVLQPWNLEAFLGRLTRAGMLDQNVDFQKASGAWSALCYKAEMEAALRTEGLGGFQLLDLQDFPGQGTALVGILDSFMDSKGVVSREVWLQSCDDVVLLLEFPKYTWSNDETFRADVRIANYSNRAIESDLRWEIRNGVDEVLEQGVFSGLNIGYGGVRSVGNIEYILTGISETEKLTIDLAFDNSRYTNMYPLWVYPRDIDISETDEILTADILNDKVFVFLRNGGSVLLFPASEDVRENSVPGLFPPDFWNYGMFKGISENAGRPVSPGTLGLLMDPGHPVFNSFPTDFHTNWQWFSMIKASNSLILDDTPPSYRPIVQVIDNLERNHKMGLIFEFTVDGGKLLVCMSRLNKIQDKPEARELYQSILKYMRSDSFDPEYEIAREDLLQLLR